ncbi:MAG: YXWGXW repeat-containing protein, partial [Acetobacteraceae bacterium]|nr:YXWGXW repeat-containing protein [Acetobacteraceae bacterium]
MRISSYLVPVLLGCSALAGCVPVPAGQYVTSSGGYAPASSGGYVSSGEITEAPPPMPEYEQPPIPAEGYLWTPGFWQYGRTGYYWIPG